MASYKIDVNIDTKNTGDGFKQTADDIDKLNKKAKEAEETINKTNKQTKEWNDSLQKVGDTSKNTGIEIDKHKTKVDNLNTSKKSLGGTLSNVTSKMGVFGSGLGKAASSAGGLGGALSGLVETAGLGGIAGLVIAAAAAFGVFAVASINAARNAQNEWAAFQGIVESTGKSFEPAKQAVKDFANKWGIAVADARSAAQKLYQTGNYSEENMKGIHEVSIGMKTNMEDAATAYTRIISGSGQYKRTLVQLGIKPEEIIDKTTGKVNAELLNQKLLEKYGSAADKQAATMDAAIQRFTNAKEALMVSFGNVLLPGATALVNGISWILGGLTSFWQQVYVNVSPAFSRLGEALGTLYNAFMSIFPPGTGGSVFNAAVSAVSWLLGATANTLIWLVPKLITLGQYLYIVGTYVYNFGMSLYSAAMWIYNLPGRIYVGIMNGVNAFVGGIYSVARWFWGLPGRLWSAFVSRIPTLRWPTSGEILGAIRGFLGMSGPAPRGSNLVASYRNQQRLSEAQKANNLRATLTATSPTVAPTAPNFGSLLNRFRGPGDGIGFNYRNYVGHQTNNPWNGDTLTGNCVDMTLGLIDRYGGGFATGTWNGGPHMWYVSPNGQQFDPARKALEGTGVPPAAGPGSGGDNYFIFEGSLIDEGNFRKLVNEANAKTLFKAGRF